MSIRCAHVCFTYFSCTRNLENIEILREVSLTFAECCGEERRRRVGSEPLALIGTRGAVVVEVRDR